MARRAAYDALAANFASQFHVSHALSIISWDAMVNMPPGGGAARGKAKAELSKIVHELLTAPAVRDNLAAVRQDAAASADFSAVERANIVEMQRAYDLAAKLPSEFVTRKTEASSEVEQAWRKQRQANDWTGFAPGLKRMVAIAQEEAQFLRQGREGDITLYEALLEKYEPGLRESTLNDVFASLRTWLPDLVKQAVSAQSPPPPFVVSFPVDKQRALVEKVTQKVFNFDTNHGRMDVSVHPFCGGVPSDVRMTARYGANDFTQSLFAAVHETGHAKYEQNRDPDWITQPVSMARSMGIHESQSLFHEMSMARSDAFLSFLCPLLTEAFGEDPAFANAESLARYVRSVSPGKIRVDADELTYPLHVMLRYDIERRLINGEMTVDDVPSAWNAGMLHALNVNTEGDFKDGCMQDIHWSLGYFGYFPTYSLGAMYAAQFMAAIKRDLSEAVVDDHLRRGEVKPIQEWLKEKVWRQGSKLSTEELVRQATGEGFNVRHFEQHLRARYAPKK